MQYFGGKARIAKEIVKVLNEYRRENQLFIEPFCGGLNITCLMDGDIIANDLNFDLIQMYKAIKEGWTPPDTITEEDYIDAKNGNVSSRLKAFIGVGCSYSGKWFGGYARGAKGRNYAKNAKNSLAKKFKTIKDVEFINESYNNIICINALIYCDPPYNNTTKYKFGDFDTNAFWQWCRDMTNKGNTVIVSEYNAPADFKCIWSKETKTDIRTKANGKETRVEKLFLYCA
jgi:DNA adenine methylase